jgi:hypothetical protein
MADLRAMLERRDATVKQLNDAIIKAIPNVISGAERFIRAREGRSGTLRWEDITFFRDEDYIMLIGVLEYKEGDLIELPNGAEFEVTEHTTEHFKRLLRLGIPYDLAALGTEDDVIDFLFESARESEESEDVIDLDELEKHLAQLPVADNPEFDEDALTDEQLEQLKLFTMTTGGKN